MKTLRNWLTAALAAAGLITVSAMAGAKPDFTNPDAVFGSIKGMLDACTKAGASNCVVRCNYAQTTLKNFLKANPEGEPGIMQQRWQPCSDAYESADLAAAPEADRSRFVVAGLPLGGDMNAHKDRMFLLRAYGYFKDAKTEYAEWVLRKGGATQPGPDLVRNYEGTIKEPAVHIFLEATADGSIYKIQFNQKQKMDPDQAKAAVIERYGKPTKRHGNYLTWGCDKGPEAGFCVKADTSASGLEIWAFDEDVKKAGYTDYDKKLMEAKGVKPGLKF